MATALIDFGCNLDNSSDELSGAAPVSFNVVKEPRGALVKRPGLVASDLAFSGVVDSDGIIGVYRTNSGVNYCVANSSGGYRKIYRVGTTGAIEIGSTNNERLAGNLRPTFAETEALLVIAGGGRMQEVELSSDPSANFELDAPLASHVVANSLRLVANNTQSDLTKVSFSDISQGTLDLSGHRDWTVAIDGPGFFTAEARPDNVVAIGESTNEIFVWGQTNLEVFAPDSTFVFSRAASREVGCLAPYSVVKGESEWYWLDHLRRFVVSDGRSLGFIGEQIEDDLESVGSPETCFGYRVNNKFLDAFVWTFPDDNVTLAYQKGIGWSKWSTGLVNQLGVNCAHLTRDGGTTLVGTSDGKILEFSLDSFADDGTEFTAWCDSGFNDRGSDNLKTCKAVHLTVRRLDDSTSPEATLQYRDDLGPWSRPLFVRLGNTSAREPTISFRGLGTYRRRQWRWTFGNSSRMALVRATEEFSVGSL